MLEKIREYLEKGYINEESVIGYLTEEEVNLVVEVCGKYSEESNNWAEENGEELNKWVEDQNFSNPIEAFVRFTHRACAEFMKSKSEVGIEG